MNPIRFRRADIPAFVLAAIVIGIGLYVYFKYPDWQPPSGFGPDWQCTAAARAAPDFCIKKPSADSAKQE